MKVCSKCGKEKPLSEYRFKDKAKNRLHSHCNECQKAYLRDHYRRNVQYYISKASVRNKKAKKAFAEFKSMLKCSICGEAHIACLDFHHRNPVTKDFNLSAMAARGYTLAQMEEEMTKCIILCSNCHRKLHYDANGILGSSNS